ncbi:hypothetical protein BDN71DRAFT_1393585 [Pleurotus eryngii]|uniref:Uncharacterized protein n=1 Tax=Pleurotus eryngii TaxID=5323 RepID=A0A9P6DF96_PLEER|nr:hypothetical protein BDN71DRAFT_1393585 [Pleurotus eryngii]
MLVLRDEDEGDTDERDGMSEVELDELNESLMPIQTVLLKLCKLSYTILHSSTKLLLTWNKTLADLKMAEWKIPQDVQTHWNLMFDMLVFAYEYCEAIDKIMSNKNASL